jgi:hypothetical protein
VHEYEGYHVYVYPAPPPGRYRIRVTWDDNGRVYGESRDITIVP